MFQTNLTLTKTTKPLAKKKWLRLKSGLRKPAILRSSLRKRLLFMKDSPEAILEDAISRGIV